MSNQYHHAFPLHRSRLLNLADLRRSPEMALWSISSSLQLNTEAKATADRGNFGAESSGQTEAEEKR